MISLVGPASATEFPLPLVTPELHERLDSLYDAGRLSELIDPHSLLGALSSDFPTPPVIDWPRPRLGTIFWPVVGMARYAFACLLVDEYTLGQLRAQMTSASSSTITINLRDDPDDAGEAARTVTMQFLASRPLVRTTSDPLTTTDNATDPVDAWVVLLVDDRYRTLTQSVTSLTTTAWSDVFSSLGVTVGDAVDADYLTPGSRWTTSRVAGRSIGWLADIAALSVGSRIVKVPGGSPTLQRPTVSNATTLSSAHTAAGTRFFGGGPIETADVYPGEPNDVRVWFGSPAETTPVNVDVTVQTNYTGPATAYLSHWCDAPASTGSGARSSLAAQWQTDWYAWQGGLYDAVYAGFIAAPASGFLWNVVWEHSAEQGTTRFVRPPDRYSYLLAPQYGSGGGVTGTGTDNVVVRWDGTSAIQDSLVSIDDTGRITTPEFVFAEGFVAAGGGVTAHDALNASASYLVMTYGSTTGGGSNHPLLQAAITGLNIEFNESLKSFVFGSASNPGATKPNLAIYDWTSSTVKSGAWGTDSLGNVFVGGLCTTVGAGAVGTGTVTSVNLTAPAAGITVSGGPITTSGSITLALANDLAALEALSGTNTIYYRSGVSTWTAVTIGTGLSFSGGTLDAAATTGPVWVKVTKTFTDFATVGGTNDVEIYSLPARGVVHSVVMQHTAAFVGGTIATYTISVGYVGITNNYITADDVHAAPAAIRMDDGSHAGGALPRFVSWAGTTSVRAYAASGGDTLNHATAGSVTFWLLVSQPG